MAQEAEGYGGYQGYGGYGQALDPASINARLALAMLQRGSDSSPIRSPWQGAARISDALFGALRLRQMQDAQSSSWQKAFAGAPTGGGLTGGGGVPGGAGAPGLPAQPGALSDLTNDPDIMRGVANAATNGLPDSATIGASMQRGAYPQQMGPPMPAMAPNNSSGGMPPGYIGGGGGPGSMAPNMTAALPASMQHNMMVAGPGAPSQVPSLPPSGPAPGNGPQGAGAGGPGAFNPQDLAMFQQDMQAVPGTPSGGGGQGGGMPAPQEVMGYAAQKAAQLGIDPQVAQRFVMGENSGRVNVAGDGGSSFGPLQLHYGGINPAMPHPGLGEEFTRATGMNARDPSTWRQQIDFGLTKAAQGGWGPWQTTMNKLGYNQWSGIGQPPAGGAPPSAMAFNGGQTPPPSGPALGAIQSAAGPGGGLAAPPGGPPAGNMFAQDMQGVPGGPASMQPHMMVAGPGAPSTGNRFTGMNAPMPPPGALGPPPGGGGNPLSALGNMFGLASPSGPQGGNGPAPAGGGAGGQAMDPRERQLMEVLSDPYAAPGAKQVAMQFLQYYLPHPTEWRTNPGTNDQQGFNPVTGQPIPSQFRPGPHGFEPIDLGTNFMGQANKGFIDKNTGQLYVFKNGQLTPISPGQGGGEQSPGQQGGAPPPSPTGTSVTPGAPNSVSPGNIPPPNPSWSPGQPLDPAIDNRLQGLAAKYAENDPRGSSMVYQYAKALLQGNQQFVASGAIAKAPYVEAAETIARQVDPDGMPQTRFDTIKQNADTSSPTALGGQRMAAQTSVRHLGSLAEASDLLASQGQVSSSEMGAELQNWAQRNLGGASSKFTDASQAYNAALVPVLGEIDKLYKGGQATEGEIMEMKSNLAPTASPSARRAALGMLGGLLQDKVQVLQDTWHMGTGKSFPDLPIIDQRGQEGLDYIKKWNAGQGQSPAPNAGLNFPPPPSGVPAGQIHAGGTPTGPIIPAPGGAQAAPAGGGSDALAQARIAIAKGAPRAAVIQRLQQMGVNPAGL